MPKVVSLKIKERVLKYLEEHCAMTIATEKDGVPWATAVFYASDGFNLYFLSDPESRHSKNIAENPLVGITVNEDYHDWKNIKGIQMEGRSRLVSSEEEMAKAIDVYAKKYPFTAPYLKPMSSLSKTIEYLDNLLKKLPFVPGLPKTFTVRFYVVIPTTVRFIDNEIGFGHKDEFTVEDTP